MWVTVLLLRVTLSSLDEYFPWSNFLGFGLVISSCLVVGFAVKLAHEEMPVRKPSSTEQNRDDATLAERGDDTRPPEHAAAPMAQALEAGPDGQHTNTHTANGDEQKASEKAHSNEVSLPPPIRQVPSDYSSSDCCFSYEV